MTFFAERLGVFKIIVYLCPKYAHTSLYRGTKKTKERNTIFTNNKKTRMKKIFTLIATALFAVSANAALDWNAADVSSLPKGTTIVDNAYATIVTGVQATTNARIETESGSADPKTYGGYTFTHYVNIRVDAAPAEANNYEGTAYSGATPAGISLILTAKQNTDVTLYYKHGDGKAVSCFDQTTKSEVAIAETPVSGVTSYYTGTYKFISGHVYTIYARGGTTGLNGISTAEGTYVAPATTVYAYYADGNKVTYSDGATMQITGNADKKYGGGSNITVNGSAYKGIKNSNGAQNTFTAATGKQIYRITFYAIPNSDGDTPKFQEFNGVTMNVPVTTTKDGTNPTKTEMCVNGATSVTFNYGGKQVNFLLDVNYSASSYDSSLDPTGGTGIQNVKAVETTDGVIYNLAGQKVDASYKGIVIKDGHKVIQK